MKKIVITLLFGASLFGFSLDSVSSMLPTAPTAKTTKQVSLAQQISSQLGVSDQQAQGGIGSILSYARNTLPANKYSVLQNAVPGADSLLKLAPAVTGGASGMGALVSQFSSLGLDQGMIAKFVPIMLNYFKSNGSFDAMGILSSLF